MRMSIVFQTIWTCAVNVLHVPIYFSNSETPLFIVVSLVKAKQSSLSLYMYHKTQNVPFRFYHLLNTRVWSSTCPLSHGITLFFIRSTVNPTFALKLVLSSSRIIFRTKNARHRFSRSFMNYAPFKDMTYAGIHTGDYSRGIVVHTAKYLCVMECSGVVWHLEDWRAAEVMGSVVGVVVE